MIVTLGFLLVALAAYTLFGGADFGGGVLEATLRKHPPLQHKIQDTLAPVWEANHVWLIAVVVILFVGFPVVYAELSTMLFVPISLALVGIILRGAFFTFRKYDPEPDARRSGYSALFRISSALTPVMYGFIVAAMLTPMPAIPESGPATFATLYVQPWATWFGLLCGVFVLTLFGYVASVFLYGEIDEDAFDNDMVDGEKPVDAKLIGEYRTIIRNRILLFFAATFLVGGLVLAYGATKGIVTLHDAANPAQLAVQTIAFLCIPLLWRAMGRGKIWQMRLIAGTQVLCILTGWFSTQYPSFLIYADGRKLTIHDGGAPDVTLLWLNIGLAVVLAAVIPLLAYLYHVFAKRSR